MEMTLALRSPVVGELLQVAVEAYCGPGSCHRSAHH